MIHNTFLRKLKKPFLLVLGILVLFLALSQTTIGKRLLLPEGLIEAVRNFFAGNPDLHACDYKEGTIILIKPAPTGDGDGRWEAGDIVNIRETDEICQRLGDIDFLGDREKTDFLVVYYPAKLTEEQKEYLTEPEYDDEPDSDESPNLLKRRKVGIDYTKFLTTDEIMKIRNFENLNKIPEIDLSSIIQKSSDQKSVVEISEYVARIESFKKGVSNLVRKIIPFAKAGSGTFTICPAGQGCNYETLSAWEAAQESNLTGGGPCIAQIQGDWTNATDTTAVVVGGGWTTTADDYIYIHTDAQNRAKASGWDNTRYRLSISNNFGIFCTGVSFIRIDGLQIEIYDVASALNTIYFSVAAGTSDIRIMNCRLRADFNSGISSMVLGLHDADGTYTIYNTIIYARSDNQGTCDGTQVGGPTATSSKIYNSIVYGVRRGIRAVTTGYLNVYDSAVFNCSSVDFYNAFNVLDYTASDDGGGTNEVAESGGGASWTNDFTNAANGDFTLLSTSALVDAGLNDPASGLFSDDIDGDPRPMGSGWDIGADEYGHKTIINSPESGYLTSGLVGMWSFDGTDTIWSSATAGTTTDVSVNSNDGTLTNMSRSSSPAIGISGQALSFDGVNDYVTGSMSGNTDSGLTIIGWMNPNYTGSGNRTLVVRGASTDSGYWTLDFRFNNRINFLKDGSTDLVARTTMAFSTGSWQHFAVTWTGGTTAATDVLFYRNGILVVHDLNTNGVSLNSDLGLNFGVGANLNPQNYYDGLIDEVRVYNRVLSPSEITDLYRLGAAKLTVNTPITNYLTSGLVGNWTFNGQDMNATTAYDRSGSVPANNGDVRGGAAKVAGISGQALKFDGSDDYIDAGSGSSLDDLHLTGGLSISAWINPWTAGGGAGVNGNIIEKDTNVAGWWDFGVFGNTGRKLRFGKDGTTELEARSSSNAITFNTWQHVVVTWDGSVTSTNVHLYVNRVETGYSIQTNGDSFIADTNLNLKIGGRNTARKFDGLIDEVRVYNRVLTAGEIQQLYQLGARKTKFATGNGTAAWACGDTVTFTYNGVSVTYGTASSTGKCWLDRNLGASGVAASTTDSAAYGDLFQWGREDDGHQVRSPAPANTEGNMTLTTQPGNAIFIKENTSPYDWATSTWITRWTVANDDPCPSGWRVPTNTEWENERLSWSSNNAAGAFASPLKLTMAGYRHYSDASLLSVGSYGFYWSSVAAGDLAYDLYFDSGDADVYDNLRARGFSVRCVKN